MSLQKSLKPRTYPLPVPGGLAAGIGASGVGVVSSGVGVGGSGVAVGLGGTGVGVGGTGVWVGGTEVDVGTNVGEGVGISVTWTSTFCGANGAAAPDAVSVRIRTGRLPGGPSFDEKMVLSVEVVISARDTTLFPAIAAVTAPVTS
jgi:hypothetical protein